MEFTNIKALGQYLSTHQYTPCTLIINNESFNLTAQCECRSDATMYKFDLVCEVIGMHRCGVVDLYIDKNSLQKHGIVIFSDIIVPRDIERQGVGTFMMEVLIKITREFVNLLSPTTKLIELRGWLSNADYNRGLWEQSLPFYKKVAEINKIAVLFKGQESEKTYSDWREYLESEAGQNGYVMFLIDNI